jgi:hypothetical protein
MTFLRAPTARRSGSRPGYGYGYGYGYGLQPSYGRTRSWNSKA